MISTDATRIVQALILAEKRDEEAQEKEIPRGPVVTISRMYGAGGHTVGRMLAERLAVRCFDKEILEAVSKLAKVDSKLMEELDEHVRDNISSWIHSMLRGGSLFNEDFRKHLVNVVFAIAARGGVIVGRGAHVILTDREDVFRVRLVGSIDRCASRIALLEGISLEAAKERVSRVDAERLEYLQTIFKGADIRENRFDLIINTDLLDTAHVVDTILFVMEKRNLLQGRGAAIRA